MSPERYLPETMGPGVAFLDYDNDGWMDVYIVNSGPCDFFTPEGAAAQRALPQQPRRHVHGRHREGGRRGRHLRHGRGGRRLRQRRLSRTCSSPPTDAASSTATTATARSPTSRRRPALARARLDHERRLVRLRQRRPARPLRLQLRRVRRSAKNVFCGDNKLGRRYYCIPRVFKPTASLLFHNNGDGTFTEVSKGTDDRPGAGQGAWASSPPTSTTTAGWTCSWPTTPSRTSCS